MLYLHIPTWVPAMSEGKKMKTHTSRNSNAAVGREVQHLNAVSRNLRHTLSRTKRWEFGNPQLSSAQDSKAHRSRQQPWDIGKFVSNMFTACLQTERDLKMCYHRWFVTSPKVIHSTHDWLVIHIPTYEPKNQGTKHGMSSHHIPKTGGGQQMPTKLQGPSLWMTENAYILVKRRNHQHRSLFSDTQEATVCISSIIIT